jgi:hypothetical protein
MLMTSRGIFNKISCWIPAYFNKVQIFDLGGCQVAIRVAGVLAGLLVSLVMGIW